MTDALSYVEIEGEYAELLPARTLLSGGGSPAFDGDASSGDAAGGGGISVINANVPILSPGDNSATGVDASAASGFAVGNLLGGG